MRWNQGFVDLFTSYVMELEWYGMLYVSMVWYGMLVDGMMLVCYVMVCYISWQGFVNSLQVMRWKQKHMYMYTS